MGQVYGEQVRAAREAAGLTLTRLGARLGVSVAHVSDIERGNRKPSQSLGDKIERELGVRYDATPEIARLREVAAIVTEFVTETYAGANEELLLMAQGRAFRRMIGKLEAIRFP